MEQQELRDWEAKCIQEEPPWCQAACPIHVDVRAFMGHMAKGRWVDARKVLDRTMPLSSVLGRICDHPCESVCKRREAGDALAIGAMERACVERTAPGKLQKLPGRGKSAAIFGGGLSGLVAAWDLARKGHGVSLYFANDSLGGSLKALPEALLPADILTQELARMESLGILFHRVASLDRTLLNSALAEHGATYIALDSLMDKDWAALGLEAYAPGGLRPDPMTLSVHLTSPPDVPGQQDQSGPENQPGLFGGGLPGQGASPIMDQVAEGRRGAASVDRFLQGSSLTASREREGPYATRLFTSVAGIVPLPRVALFTAEAACTDGQAMDEASRCLLCECLECVKVCVYLERFKGYPKKFTREIYNNEAIVQGIHQANTLINSCARCGLCATVCPNNFNMGDLCASVRAGMVKRGKMPASAHDFALRDLAFNTSDLAAMARHEPDRVASAYLFFPGCQLSGSSPGQVRRVYGHLRENLSGGVGLMLNCCGAPADWAGQADLFAQGLEAVRASWRALGQPTLVLACPTCVATFKAHAPDLPTVSLWEVLERTGVPGLAEHMGHDGPAGQTEKSGHEGQARLAVRGSQCCSGGLPGSDAAHEAAKRAAYALHDPCTARHAPAIRASVRAILVKMGVIFEELELGGEMTECCGYGGLMDAANPVLARDTALRRAGRSASNYLAYCAMCRDSLSRQGKPVVHILDLLFPEAAEEAQDFGLASTTRQPSAPGRACLPEDSLASGTAHPFGETHPLVRRAPGFADRHETRARLKNTLLRELWSEPGQTPQPHAALRLDIAPEVQQSMDARRILLDDLQRAIFEAEATGRKSTPPGKDRFLAGQLLAAVTYWVEYSPVPGDLKRFTIHNAWSHRMVLMDLKEPTDAP